MPQPENWQSVEALRQARFGSSSAELGPSANIQAAAEAVLEIEALQNDLEKTVQTRYGASLEVGSAFELILYTWNEEFEGVYGRREARIDFCHFSFCKIQLSSSNRELSDCTM